MTDVRTLTVQQEYFNNLASGLFGLHYSSGVEDNGSTIRYAHTSEKLEDSAWAWKSGIRGFFVSNDGGATWRLGWDTADKVVKTAVEAVGVNANILGSGTLRTALVKILGTNQFYWDADAIVMEENGKLIKIGQYRTGDYGIAVSTDNGVTWTTIIDFDGLHGGGDGGGGGETIIYRDDITKSAIAPTNPDLNDLWVDTVMLRLRMWNGSEWVNIGYEPEEPEPDPDPDPDPTPDPDDPGEGEEDGGGDDPGKGGEDGGGDDPTAPGDDGEDGEPEEGGS